MAAYRDRIEAGRRLAARLERYKAEAPIILGLPRGGVEVAAEVARALGAPLDIVVARKLGAPWQPELGIGAVAPDGVLILDEYASRFFPIEPEELEKIAARERIEVERRVAQYRDGRPAPDLTGRTVILVDDGLATGVTARAAIEWVRRQNPRNVIFAAPVCAPQSADILRQSVDEVACILEPPDFAAVGYWYGDFSQLTDDDVRRLLREHYSPAGEAEHTSQRSREVSVRISADSAALDGDLTLTADAIGIVLFAHGSGSSRHSKRNRYVASVLNESGIATLLMDLLTEEEEASESHTGHLRFDIPFLARRLIAATRFVRQDRRTAGLPIGYFGASTGAAAALVAAAQEPAGVRAVVSRGGRPDLAAAALPSVRAPTLLIVGGDDMPVIPLNESALARMRSPESRIVIIPGATHLFEEAGTLEEAARLASEWFRERFLGAEPAQAA